MLKIINIETETLRPDELGFKDVRAFINVSDATELRTAYGKFRFTQGSRAWVIDESAYYGLNDEGIWVKQNNGGGSEAVIVSKTITANGTYNASSDSADGYNPVVVNVANSYTAGDEGKVVDNGALVAQTAYPTEITANDTYDTTLYNSVTVNVPTGGGAVEEKDVNFYDYDGTLLYSYTAQEFLALSEMPANPTHTGLTAQGWNWTLSDAQTYVTSYKVLDIAQKYISASGDLEIYVTVPSDKLDISLNCTLGRAGGNAGTVEVDWGDNTAPDTITGSAGTFKTQNHSYAQAGDYIIKVSYGTSDTYFFAASQGSAGAGLIASANYAQQTSTVNESYRSLITKIICGNGYFCVNSNSNIGALSACNNLTYIIGNISNVSSYAFSNSKKLSGIILIDSFIYDYPHIFDGCNSIKKVIIHYYTYAKVPANAYQNCWALDHIIVGNTVTSIDNQALQGLSTVKYIKFIPTTPPSISAFDTISNIAPNCIIYVPTGTLTAYTTASNYPDPNTYTYVEY